ncbi:YceI family protein [Mucilaginibacter sp. UYCu711]|uniref:YceI family protein n=1 Tax=Mucilaginibacter sp. UYCu711 TaxID=3156339 RepID=UPI003D2125DC
MKKIISILAVALLTITAVSAQSTWKVDKNHSKLTFTITHLAVSDVEGLFKDFDVTVVATKPDFSDAKFTLVAQTATINTEIEKRDNHLKSPDFFDIAKYPTMNFVSTGITKGPGANRYKVTGNLTLHGVTKPVTMDLWYRGTIAGQGGKEVAGFQLTGEIKRSDFSFGSKFTSPMLSDEVQIKANGEFSKS